ncbi:MAG: hypothetical protein ACO1NW_18870 [Chitinophagaceae bacterium]
MHFNPGNGCRVSDYNMHSSIQHITRDHLDTKAYDACIEQDHNGNIYAQSWYLDRMATHWDILVKGNYEAVMPLPWRKKYGVKYLYMPAFTPMLGIYGAGADRLTQAFLEAIPSSFRFWEISLHKGNPIPAEWQPSARANYVLPLQQDYTALFSGYKQNIQRNCKKAMNLGCSVVRGFPVSEVTAIAKTQLQPISNISDQDFTHFEALYRFLEPQGRAITYGVKDAGGKLLSSCVFFFSHGRAYYILVGNHPNGRTLGASHALIDGFIRDHAGQDLILDFEGSDIRNLAYFYSSFGSVMETYHRIKVNRLPWWMKLVKK